MGSIVISQNVTLDGVVEDPTGEEGFKHGGWFEEFMGDDRVAWAEAEFAEAVAADALLMGRRTDAYFGPRWNTAEGDWADRLRKLPKYVISSKLRDPIWVNSTVLRGDPIEEATNLKQQINGEIIVYASRQLSQALLEHNLVDEIRLMVFPVALGTGARLFGGTSDKQPLRLLSARPIGANLSCLTYQPVKNG